ncbi:endo-1,4-beta-xylanase [candidate division KSB1 bacterium]|nr:endo-1,4-beta-xylanase [candidate division KSB1 bacterium]
MSYKNLLLKRSFISCVLLILTLAASNVNAQLVTNGSFEASSPGVVTDAVTGWVLQLMDGAEANFEIVDDVAQHGTNSMKITATTLGANQWSIQIVADSIPVTPGTTYNYSMWAKAERSGAQANFTIGNYSFSEYGAIRPATITTEWQEYTMEFTVSDNQTVIRAPIHFNYAGNADNAIYIDHLVITNPEANNIPVIVEAESGDVGSDYSILQEDSTEYVAIQTNSAAYNPESKARIISYEVTFPDTGSYDLFVRLRVGADSFNDDSFFYGNGFGAKDSITDADWILSNGLAAAGFSDPNEVVYEAGGLGSGVWKWVNLSRNAYQAATTVTFMVAEDGLTQTFQIGAREDGLEIDKIAFGKSSLYFTVHNLDNGEPGSTELPGEIWEGPPLASKQLKFVGNVHSSAQIQNFEAYWNQVTPENAGKWGSVEGTRDNMNWGGLDAAYKLAKDNDFPFHFHVLVWGAQQPSWISSLEPQEQLEEITEWFEAVAERYPDIDYLEVVNEPLPGHNPPDGSSGRANYKAALGGDGETGWDWVINAFRMAREIFPSTTKLMLNDFSIINSTSSTSRYLEIIRLLQAENLIDIIAEQGHAFTTTASTAIMKKNLDSLAVTGIPIQITELDIDGSTDAIQLTNYQRIFPALYEHPGVEGITLWGWRRGLWRDSQGAYLVNQDGSERLALEWMRTYLDTLNIEPVAVDDIVQFTREYSLDNNYPNPFNPTTNIRYSVAAMTNVHLSVFDVLGREVRTLVNEVKSPGEYMVTFNAENLASGVYFYRIHAGSFSATKKLILLQ